MNKSESRRGKLKIYEKNKKHRYMRGGMLDLEPTAEDLRDLKEFEMGLRGEQEKKDQFAGLTDDQRQAAQEQLRRQIEDQRENERNVRIEEAVKSICGTFPERYEKKFARVLDHLKSCLNSPGISWGGPYPRLITDLKYKTRKLEQMAQKGGQREAARKIRSLMDEVERLINEKKKAKSMESAADASAMQVAAPEAEAAAPEPAPAPTPLSLSPSDTESLENMFNPARMEIPPRSLISPESHDNLRNTPEWQGGTKCGPAPTYLCNSASDDLGNYLSSRSCMICGNKYTIFKRKHHCRRCGISVCGGCSSRKLTLKKYLEDKKPHDYLDHGVAKDVRVCNLCHWHSYHPPSDSVTLTPTEQSDMAVDVRVTPTGQSDITDLFSRLDAVKAHQNGGGKRKSKRKKTQRRKKSIKKSKRRNFKKSNRKSKKKRRNKTKRR